MNFTEFVGFELPNAIYNAPVFNLKQFNAANNGTTDDTGAISSALEAVGNAAASGAAGGTIVLPRGKTLFEAGAINKNFSGLECAINFVGMGTDSVLLIREDSTDKMQINNALSFTLKNMVVMGALASDEDNRTQFDERLFHFSNVLRLRIEDIKMVGIRSATETLDPNCGAIFAEGCNVSLKRVMAGGCETPSKGFVTLKNWLSLTVEDSEFIDYMMFNGTNYAIDSSSSAWLYTYDPVAQFGRSSGAIKLENVNLDEGVAYAIYVQGDGEGGTTGSVEANRVTVNVGTGEGLHIEDTRVVKINQFWSGLLPSGSKPAIVAHNVDALDIDGATLANNVDHIHLTGTTKKVTVKNSNLNVGATYKTGFLNDAGARIFGGDVPYLQFAVSDESTALTTGTAKITFRMPHAYIVTGVRASLATASSSGAVTVDINEAGATILSTKLSIDATEKTSVTAAAAAVSDPALADDAEITIDIDAAGTGAKGLKVIIEGYIPR